MYWRTVGQLQVSPICRKEGLSPQRWPGKQVGWWHGADFAPVCGALWMPLSPSCLCRKAHGVLDFSREGSFVAFGSHGISESYFFLIVVPFLCEGRPPSILPDLPPISFQRHPYSNFRQLWLLAILPFVTIQLIGNELLAHLLLSFVYQSQLQVHSSKLMDLRCLFHCVSLCVTSSVEGNKRGGEDLA